MEPQEKATRISTIRLRPSEWDEIQLLGREHGFIKANGSVNVNAVLRAGLDLLKTQPTTKAS